MNERIQELMAQAGFDPDAIQRMGVMPQAEKFAELIVQECVSVIQQELDAGQYSQPVFTGLRVAKNMINERFGADE